MAMWSILTPVAFILEPVRQGLYAVPMSFLIKPTTLVSVVVWPNVYTKPSLLVMKPLTFEFCPSCICVYSRAMFMIVLPFSVISISVAVLGSPVTIFLPLLHLSLVLAPIITFWPINFVKVLFNFSGNWYGLKHALVKFCKYIDRVVND